MLLQIAQAILAIAKAVPKVQELLELMWTLFIDWKLSQIEDHQGEKVAQRKALIQAIKKAKTNEERLHLSRLMYDLVHGRV